MAWPLRVILTFGARGTVLAWLSTSALKYMSANPVRQARSQAGFAWTTPAAPDVNTAIASAEPAILISFFIISSPPASCAAARVGVYRLHLTRGGSDEANAVVRRAGGARCGRGSRRGRCPVGAAETVQSCVRPDQRRSDGS